VFTLIIAYNDESCLVFVRFSCAASVKGLILQLADSRNLLGKEEESVFTRFFIFIKTIQKKELLIVRTKKIKQKNL
jgi:hypothetical protein